MRPGTLKLLTRHFRAHLRDAKNHGRLAKRLSKNAKTREGDAEKWAKNQADVCANHEEADALLRGLLETK